MTRHVGIGVGTMVWHYSNSQRQVVKQTIATFLNHFSGNTVMVLGQPVPGKVAAPFGVSVPSRRA